MSMKAVAISENADGAEMENVLPVIGPDIGLEKITGSEAVVRSLLAEGCGFNIWLPGWCYHAGL